MADLDLDATHFSDPNAVMADYASYNLATPDGIAFSAGDTPVNKSSISLDPLPISGIQLKQGLQPLGASIKMTSTGIVLSYGGPVGAKIEMTATGITISFGPALGGASINLAATGLTLKFGLTNQIQLGPQGLDMKGIKVAMQALASLQVQCLELTETAAKVSRTGGLTTIM
jgi:hypothetical protein